MEVATQPSDAEDPMNALWIITVFDLIDELMQALEHRSHVLA